MNEATYDPAAPEMGKRTSRKLANNTYARLEDDGRIVVKYHDTDILTFHPNGEVEYQSGGWLTYTTKDRFNRFGAKGITVSQTKGRWFVHGHGRWDEAASDYYDGIRFKDGMVVGEARHEVDPDKKIKKGIDRYVALYTNEKIAEIVSDDYNSRGECWYCMMRETGTGIPLGELGHGNTDHLESHLEEGYVLVNLAFNAVKAAGYINPVVILHFSPDLVRRAIKRYLRQRLATNTAGAAGGPKPIASGF